MITVINYLGDNGSDKGHGRSTSWDLTKMLRDEGDLRCKKTTPTSY